MAEVFWSTDSDPEQFAGSIGESSAWDTAILGGRQLPGLVKIDQIEPGRKIDVRMSPGTDGATIVDQGFEPANPVITIKIWTPEQWATLQSILSTIYPKPGKSTGKIPAAIPLVHPGANLLGVNAVLVKSITAPEMSGPGIYDIKIKCIQWVKPKKAVIGQPQLRIGTVAETESVQRPSAPSAPSTTNSGP